LNRFTRDGIWREGEGYLFVAIRGLGKVGNVVSLVFFLHNCSDPLLILLRTKVGESNHAIVRRHVLKTVVPGALLGIMACDSGGWAVVKSKLHVAPRNFVRARCGTKRVVANDMRSRKV